jgi:hypothetical protein
MFVLPFMFCSFFFMLQSNYVLPLPHKPLLPRRFADMAVAHHNAPAGDLGIAPYNTGKSHMVILLTFGGLRC